MEPLVRLPDGTVKQVSPVTGTVVWTVPSRGRRPMPGPAGGARPVEPGERDRLCAFCAERYRETPPERARLVLDGARPRILRDVPAEELDATVAELRRIPNLFEIVSVDYWRRNHGFEVPPQVRARAAAYTATAQGRAHVLALLERRAVAEGWEQSAWRAQPEARRLAQAEDLFAGSHDVVVARRHLVDGATSLDELAGSGTLTPDEHGRYMAFTVAAAQDLYALQPSARHVAVFQNWLRPAGASFDHLHKQLVAIDEHGPRTARVLARLRDEPGLYDTVLGHASAHGLVVAENDHAVAVAGVGHRFPSLEVHARGPHRLPWEHTPAEVRGMSDLVHAVHAATGVHVPTNEEWYQRPVGTTAPVPWHVLVTWRVSTIAGFEGGTEIYINTIDPWSLRDQVVGALADLRDAGSVAPMRVGDECGEPGRG